MSRAARRLLGRSPAKLPDVKALPTWIKLSHPRSPVCLENLLSWRERRSPPFSQHWGFKEARSELRSFSLLFPNATAGRAIG